MDNCIFCKIVKGELPASIIDQTEHCIAFLDIHPVNKGHILVIPKDHHLNILETPDQVLQDLILFTKKIASAVPKAFETEYFNVFNRKGTVAGQEVRHLHFHILPRYPDDGIKVWSGRFQYNEGEADEVVKKIKDSLL